MSAIWDAIVPPADASKEEVMRWRTILAICVFVCISFIPVSYNFYAHAGEVKAISAEVSEIKLQLLEQALFDVRLRQCKADTPETKQYYYTRLQEKMNAYYEITGRNYRPPACAEIQ